MLSKNIKVSIHSRAVEHFSIRRLVFLLLACSLAIGTELPCLAGGTTPWKSLLTEAKKMSRAGQKQQAEEKLRLALSMAKKSGASVPQLAKIYHAMADMNTVIIWEDNNPPRDRAMLYQTIVDMYDRNHQPPDRYVVDARWELGEHCLSQGKEAEAWKEFRKTLDLMAQARDVSDSDRGWYCQLWALRLQERGRYKEADQHFKQFMAYADKGPNNQHRELGLLRYLKNLMMMGRHSEAVPIFHKALESWKNLYPNLADQNYDVTTLVFLGDTANDIGYSLLALRKYADASRMLEQAVSLRERSEQFSKTNDSARKQSGLDTSVSLCGLARCLANTGKPGQASQLLSRAYKLAKTDRNPLNFPYAELVDACARYQGSQKIASAAEITRVYQDYERTAFESSDLWPVYLEAANRYQREGSARYWGHNDIPVLLRMAEKEVSKYGGNDLRSVLVNLGFVAFYREGDSKKSLKYFERTLKSAPIQKVATVKAILEHLNVGFAPGGDNAVERLGLEIDFLKSEKQLNPLLKPIAKQYVSSLCKSRWSDSGKGREAARHLDVLTSELGENSADLFPLLPAIAAYYEDRRQYYDAMMIYRRIVAAYKKQYGKSKVTKKALIKYSSLLARTNDLAGAARARKEADAM